jgi:hypothetical protein
MTMNMNARILDEHDRLDAWLADGATGRLWRVHDLAPGRPVAVPRPHDAPEAPVGGAEEPDRTAEPEDPKTAALAAITTRYENARARIISAAPPTPAGPGSAPGEPEAGSAGWLPTVPVDLGTGLPVPRRHRTLADAAPIRSAKSSRPRGKEMVRALLTRLVTDLGVIPPGTSGWELDLLPPVGPAIGPI